MRSLPHEGPCFPWVPPKPRAPRMAELQACRGQARRRLPGRLGLMHTRACRAHTWCCGATTTQSRASFAASSAPPSTSWRAAAASAETRADPPHCLGMLLGMHG